MKYRLLLIRVIPVFILAAILLSACQPNAPVPLPTKVGQEVPTAEIIKDAQEPTAPPDSGAQPTKESIQPQDQGPQAPKPDCVKAGSPFPPVKDDEWMLGNKEAKITILEYSDFM
ncbi:MAG: hypothetical protein WCI88_03225 [Chloroflexota bacterium]|jgi:hypothetical protein